MVPVPTDPDFKIEHPSDEDYFNPKGREDETLIDTGAFDDEEDDADEPVDED
jgi:hypothetical protein